MPAFEFLSGSLRRFYLEVTTMEMTRQFLTDEEQERQREKFAKELDQEDAPEPIMSRLARELHRTEQRVLSAQHATKFSKTSR